MRKIKYSLEQRNIIKEQSGFEPYSCQIFYYTYFFCLVENQRKRTKGSKNMSKSFPLEKKASIA